MGKLRIEIVWGVGRHGPGNDVFFHGARSRWQFGRNFL
jgi:hypothetical protein